MTIIKIDDYFGNNDIFEIETAFNEVSIDNAGIYNIIRTDVIGGIVANELREKEYIDENIIKKKVIEFYDDIINETIDETEEILNNYIGKKVQYPENIRYTNEEIADWFIYNNWHILLETKDVEKFLNYAQLDTLKQKDNSLNKTLKEQLKHVDVEKVMEIIYNNYIKEYPNIEEAIKDCGGYEANNLRIRQMLLNDAKHLLYRLNNEELRDIIYQHPFRDLDDIEYDDNRINAENLSKDYNYDSMLAKKIISKCNTTPCDMYKEHYKELKQYRR